MLKVFLLSPMMLGTLLRIGFRPAGHIAWGQRGFLNALDLVVLIWPPWPLLPWVSMADASGAL